MMKLILHTAFCLALLAGAVALGASIGDAVREHIRIVVQ